MGDYSEWSVYEINSAILTLKVKATGRKPRIDLAKDGCSARCLNTLTEFNYNNPEDAWPIIVDNEICIEFDATEDGFHRWCNASSLDGELTVYYQSNPLRAAMIVFLMMKEAEHE